VYHHRICNRLLLLCLFLVAAIIPLANARRQVVVVGVVDVVLVVVNVVLVVRRAVAVGVAIVIVIVVRCAIAVDVVVLPPVAFLANERWIVICFDWLALSSKVNLHARIASGTDDRGHRNN
jgi:hypothetical protein